MAVRINKEKCTGCGRCIKVCSANAITLKNKIADIIKNNCIDCQACVIACKRGAISI